MSKSPASRKSNAAPHARAGAGKLQKVPELAEGELAEGRFLSLSKGGVAMKNGWQTKQLREVAEIFDGPHATPKTVDTGPVFLGISALQDGVINLGETRHVTEQDYKRWTRRVRPQPQDVVFSYETRLGQAAIIPGGLECCLGRRMGLVRFKGGAVVPQFFLYQYISPLFREFLDSKTIRGATVDRISIKDFPSFPIAFPPLPEQQRIVGILDAAFEGLATAKANAEKNLLNARALFDSHLQAVFSQRSLSGAEGRGKGWVEKALGEICEINSKLIDPRKKEFLDLTHVGAGNIESQTGTFVDLKTARKEGLISGKFLFDESMVLYSKIRPYLMKVARPDFNGLCSADMYPLAPFPKEITRNYLFHLLMSKGFTDYAIQGSARAGMPKVNREHLFEFKVWLPPVRKQEELSTTLDSLQEETQRLAAIYQRKLAALESLKKSLLHQAFTGEL